MRVVIKPSTVMQYKRILSSLQKRWARHVHDDSRKMPWRQRSMDFCQWFIDTAASGIWTKRTYWLYRAACLWHFNSVGHIEAAEAISRMSSTGLPSRKDVPATSSRKLKRLSGKMLDGLLHRLRTGIDTSSLDLFIASWLEVGIYTGLRPIEWKDASFDRQTCTLTVQNAKYDAVRGNGPQRHIIFDKEKHRKEMTAIMHFLEDRDVFLRGTTFKALYERCRKRLWYICSGLWPKAVTRPSLYSTRHQFSANMKKAGLSHAEVAALMGHRSDMTATFHYGRKVSGTAIDPPASPSSEVASVRMSIKKGVYFYKK